MIRYKISAGDLQSAESILEVHRAEKGEDADYLLGLAWTARGAALTGDWKAASTSAQKVKAIAESRLGESADYEAQSEATYALGTALEIEAQALVAARKKSTALRFLDESLARRNNAPFNFRARLWKRKNQIDLEGRKAPEIVAEDSLQGVTPKLESLRGNPVVLFCWRESCGDCQAQAPALRRVVEKYAPQGVQFVALTRFYTTDHAGEKMRIEKACKERFAFPDSVAIPISDTGMVRYGAAATPTFAFIDRRGVVRLYAPTRLTEARMSAMIEKLLQ